MKITKTIKSYNEDETTIIEANSTYELLAAEKELKTGITEKKPHLISVAVAVKDGFAEFKGEKYPARQGISHVFFPDECFCTDGEHRVQGYGVTGVGKYVGFFDRDIGVKPCDCESHSE